MKSLKDFQYDIRKCSKCGLCQAECPIYKVTGNDCTVSRGLFNMLNGVVKGDLKLSKTINRYLDLCLKCGKCKNFCPSGIDAVDVIVTAKSEYFKAHYIEKLISLFQKNIIFGLIPKIFRIFIHPTKSKNFDSKVLYFGGCGSKLKGDKAIINILNSIGVEVINPEFQCCGIPFWVRGDLKEFENSIDSYIKILKKYEIKEVITTCASCEKSLNDYIKWAKDIDKDFLSNIKVVNVYEYLKISGKKIKLKKNKNITYHKPCNLDNFNYIEWILNNTENLNYIEMDNFNECCGLNGLSKIQEYKTMKKIFKSKRKNIIKSGAKIVLTSCLGCESALKLYSFGKYKVFDLIDFLGKNT
jgi:Fe-S oxidoreductase